MWKEAGFSLIFQLFKSWPLNRSIHWAFEVKLARSKKMNRFFMGIGLGKFYDH
jgi:hypothetical protein